MQLNVPLSGGLLSAPATQTGAGATVEVVASVVVWAARVVLVVDVLPGMVVVLYGIDQLGSSNGGSRS